MTEKPDCVPIIAITYDHTQEIDVLLVRVAERLKQSGLHLTGLVQRDEPRADRARCDMVLEELASGERFRISEDRGKHARGCRLNIDFLLKASDLVQTALLNDPDLVILNKFGKTEAEGGGLRDLIAIAFERSIPLLVAVPYRNLDSWRIFSGELSRELSYSDRTDFIDLVCSHFIKDALSGESAPISAANIHAID